MARRPPAWAAVAAVGALVLLVLAVRSDRLGRHIEAEAKGPDPVLRDLEPYHGYGTWVDAFDYGPAYQTAGHPPSVTPDDVAAMADAGVTTLYLQARRDDPRSPGGWIDKGLLDRFVVAAHDRGLRVVGWYLPTFAHVPDDLANLEAMLDYEHDGHRLDGVAVDIEYTEAVPDIAHRNRRLVRLSQDLRAVAGDEPLGAIVLPPVLTEVVNPDLWPAFPWAEIAPLYDVWLPMSYWTYRTPDSGYDNGATYHEESVRRLKRDLGLARPVIHGIGGIGDEATVADLRAFAAVLSRTGAVGGSVYDWATLSEEKRTALADAYVELGPG